MDCVRPPPFMNKTTNRTQTKADLWPLMALSNGSGELLCLTEVHNTKSLHLALGRERCLSREI